MAGISSCTNQPSDLSALAGTLGYYRARYDDFVCRHPGQTPPDYYLNYGEKYFKRFDALAKDLSPRGQVWVHEAARQIALHIEKGLSLESDGIAFRAYVFGIHPDSYLSAGLGGLPLSDIAKIAITPDLSDLLSWNGIKQSVEVGWRMPGAMISAEIDDFNAALAPLADINFYLSGMR